MLDKPKGPEMAGLQEEREALVTKFAAVLGKAELHLDGFKKACDKAEDLAIEGYRLGMITGTECMVLRAQIGGLRGDASSIEEKGYPIHAFCTAKAQEAGADVVGPYSVLKNVTMHPELVTTMDGGR